MNAALDPKARRQQGFVASLAMVGLFIGACALDDDAVVFPEKSSGTPGGLDPGPTGKASGPVGLFLDGGTSIANQPDAPLLLPQPSGGDAMEPGVTGPTPSPADGLGHDAAATLGESGGKKDAATEPEDPPTSLPGVALVVDRSGSMRSAWNRNTPGQGPSRWEQLKGVLQDEAGAAARLQNRLALAWVSFTAQANICPDIQAKNAAKNNHGKIRDAYQNQKVPDGDADSPTAEAIKAAVNTLQSTIGQKSILLFTDGVPDTCANRRQQCGMDSTIVAIQDAYAKGIRTFVVRIGSDGGASEFLHRMSNAGLGQAVEDLPKDYQRDCGGKDATAQGQYEKRGGDGKAFLPTSENLADTVDQLISSFASARAAQP